MKNLAIDTSSEVCGVALLEDDKLIDDNSLNNGKTHSENLMPLIKDILERNNLELKDIGLISCVVGPGSFTGIRIGIASVKAMAEVYSIKIASVASLEVLVQVLESKTKVSMIDARNDQVYCGIFDENNNLLEDYIADDINVAIEKISKYEDISICGNGAEKFKNLILEKIPSMKFSDENFQKAENAGKAGFRKFLSNDLMSADTIMPIYLRKSQAERLKQKI